MFVKPIPPLPPSPILPPHPTALPKSGTGTFLQFVLLPLLLLGIFMLIALITVKKSKDKYPDTKYLPWMITAFGIGFAILLAHGVSMIAFQGMLLCSILIYASISDIKSHEVPDFIWVMILILALVGFEPENLLNMIIGAIAVFVPQIAIAMIKPGTYGGADIKISTALAFLLGTGKGLFAVIFGLIIAVVTMLVLRKMKKLNKDDPYPIVPFLSIGAMLAFLF